MSFGHNLAKLRIEKGICQKEVAAYMNVTIATISNYETNRHFPDAEALCKLADYFGVTVDYMLGRTSFRYDPQLLYKPLTKNYTVSDLINTSLELSPKNRYLLKEYVQMLSSHERTSSSGE